MIWYTEFCVACDTFVVRRGTHTAQKQHGKNSEGYLTDPIIKKEAWKAIPVRHRKRKSVGRESEDKKGSSTKRIQIAKDFL